MIRKSTSKYRSERSRNLQFERLEPRLAMTTFLVNFDNGGANVNDVAASDFAVADPDVVAAEVHAVGGGGQTVTGLLASDDSMFDVTVGPGDGGLFSTNSGTFANQPIIDSYLVNRSSTNFRTVTVSSLEEIAAGSTVTVTLHGVGDQEGQDTEFQVTYDGVSLGTQETDFDSGNLDDTFVTFSFTKVAGVDSVDLQFREASEDNGSFGGFSLVAESQQAIRINAGGGEHVDADGNVFLADQFFTGSIGTFSTGQDIFEVGTGTNLGNDSDVDDILFQTERFGPELAYEIPVADGLYDVNLLFAEIFFDDANERVFDISIEGVLVADNFDIFGTRMNAFTPGDFASLDELFSGIQVTDGFLSIEFDSTAAAGGTNNAKLSALEILPVTGPGIALVATDGATIVSEAGLTDTIGVVLTEAPASDVVVTLATGNDVAADVTTLTFTAANFDVAQTVVVSAVQDTDEEGQQNVQVQATSASSDPDFDNITSNLNVTVLDDDLIPVEFDVSTIANIDGPTRGTFGPDGRLYVATISGEIQALTFDNDYNVIDTEIISTISNLDDPGAILGIAFNPFEEVAPGETATLFVTQSFLFRATEDFENRVLALSGPNHSVLTEVITGLPTSGFDHGINGLTFDGEGNLLINVGGNTNIGVFDNVFGSDAPESPLTSAILRARISDPNFNGNIQYEFIDPNDPELLALADELNLDPDPNNQLFGEFVQVLDVAGEVEVETFAVGLRNSFDSVFTTNGTIFATDNGPNGIAEDELNFVSEGDFLGHPSIPRGRLDPRQAFENTFEVDTDGDGTPDSVDPEGAVAAGITQPLLELESSTNGIDEFRSEVFGGQLQGQLVAQRFNNEVFFFELDETGTDIANINTFGGGQIADGLDILTGPGGVIFGIDLNQDRITIARPVDNSVVTSTAFDIFPFRAPAVGGNQFTIGGVNFGDIADTTVLIDGFEAELISVESNRIVGVFPTVPASTVLRDVTVISDQAVSILEGSFLPLGEGLNEVVGRNVFFNDSFFDDNDASANTGDDNAIATNITALQAGEATLDNISSFVHGINGIIVDAHLADPAAFSAEDIVLSSGIGNTLSDFEALGVTPEITVRAGEGVDGSDRITVILPNGSVTNEYLQVRVLANANTGLVQDDVFYFGSIVGETGNSSDTFVSAGDISGVEANLSGLFSESIENPFDINRDGFVSAGDVSAIQANLTGLFAVPLITAPVDSGNQPLTVFSVAAAADDGDISGPAEAEGQIVNSPNLLASEPRSLALASVSADKNIENFLAVPIGTGTITNVIPSFRSVISPLASLSEFGSDGTIHYPEIEVNRLSGAQVDLLGQRGLDDAFGAILESSEISVIQDLSDSAIDEFFGSVLNRI